MLYAVLAQVDLLWLPHDLALGVGIASKARPTAVGRACHTGEMCLACKTGHYHDSRDATCLPCPASQHAELLNTAGPFLGALGLIYLVMALAVHRLETMKKSQEPMAIALRQSKEFCIWTCLSAQIMATASASTFAGIPSYLGAVYTCVAFFNLDTSSVVNAECLSAPFTVPTTVLSICVALLSFTAIMFAFAAYHRWKALRLGTVVSLKILGKTLAGFQGALLAPCGNATIRSLRCTESCCCIARFCSIVRVRMAGRAGVSEGTLFVILSAIYPTVAKNVLYLLNCQPSAQLGGALVLVNGPLLEVVSITPIVGSVELNVTSSINPIRCACERRCVAAIRCEWLSDGRANGCACGVGWLRVCVGNAQRSLVVPDLHCWSCWAVAGAGPASTAVSERWRHLLRSGSAHL